MNRRSTKLIFLVLVISVIERTAFGRKVVGLGSDQEDDDDRWIWGYVNPINSYDENRIWGYLDKDESNSNAGLKESLKSKTKIDFYKNRYASRHDLPLPPFFKKLPTKTKSSINHLENTFQSPILRHSQIGYCFAKTNSLKSDSSFRKYPLGLIQVQPPPFSSKFSFKTVPKINKNLHHNSATSIIQENHSPSGKIASLQRVFKPQNYSAVASPAPNILSSSKDTNRLSFDKIFAAMSAFSSNASTQNHHVTKSSSSFSTPQPLEFKYITSPLHTNSSVFFSSPQPNLSLSNNKTETSTSGIIFGTPSSPFATNNGSTTLQMESSSPLSYLSLNNTLSPNKMGSLSSEMTYSIFGSPSVSKSKSSTKSAFPNIVTKSQYISDTQSQNSSVEMPSSINKNQSLQEKDVKENPCDRKIAAMPNFSAPGRRISEEKCYEYIWQIKTREESTRNEKDCETYNKKHGIDTFHTEAIGGRVALPGEFPHMGAIGWKPVTGSWIFKCGSSLISSKFVVTAAHCSKASTRDSTIDDPIPKVIRFGDKNIIDEFSNGLFPNDANIKNIIVHPEYKSPKKYNDIALMELEHDMEFNYNIQPACLWKYFDTKTIGKKATLTGWGVIKAASYETSPLLQVAEVELIDSKTCDALLKPFCNRLWCGIQNTQICAGNLTGGVDACQGDSGGPLQVKIPLPITSEGAIHYLIGIISFGFKCAEPGVPGVYTRISPYLDWIEGIVWPKTA